MRKDFFKIIQRVFIILLPFIAVIMANILSSLNLKHFCLIKFLTSHQCFGCGLTRALAALGRLDFKAAYEFNHFIVFVVPVLFFAWIMLLKNEFKN